MSRIVLILSLVFVSSHALGELSIINSPSSLDFKGNDKINAENVGNILSAGLGLSVDGSSKWSGLYVNNPFDFPTSGLVFSIDGIDKITFDSKAKSYPIVGNGVGESLNLVASDFKVSNLDVLYLDFTESDDPLLTYKEYFGEAPSIVVKPFGSLKPELHAADKTFLTQITCVNVVADKLRSIKKKPSLIIIRLSLSPVALAHGEKSPAMSDAIKLIVEATENLKSSSTDQELFVSIVNKENLSRSIRQTKPANETDAKTYNLAVYYNPDYPVIFNIILWFMVAFGLSLLAVCYAIGSMDPGRDSIIYRMTSTRMKKDN